MDHQCASPSPKLTVEQQSLLLWQWAFIEMFSKVGIAIASCVQLFVDSILVIEVVVDVSWH